MLPLWKVATPTEKLILVLAGLTIIGTLVYWPFTCLERWGQVAQPLFALSSGLLFFMALTMQMREITQANANHQDTLRVAREEKEFSVCLVAYGDLLDDIYAMSDDGKSFSGIERIMLDWVGLFTLPHDRDQVAFLNDWEGRPHPFKRWEEIDSYLRRLHWLVHSVRHKDLSSLDRNYLMLLTMHLLGRLESILQAHLTTIARRMAELSITPWFRQHARSGSVDVLQAEYIESLRDQLVKIRHEHSQLRSKLAPPSAM